MINQNVKRTLKHCMAELMDIRRILNSTSMHFNRITKYLTNYAIIKSCGSIEFSYKCLIADFFGEGQSEYITNFLSIRIRDSPANPEISIIHRMLISFDKELNEKFKNRLKEEVNRDQLIESLNSLRTERHKLAHGGASTIPLIDVLNYFKDSRRIIEILDETLYKNEDLSNFCFLFSGNT